MELYIIILEGAIIAVLIWWVRLLEISTRKSARLFSERLEAERRLYDAMRNFSDTTGIERVLIFKTINGDSKPAPGAALHVSCIYEGPASDVKERYQRVSVDEAYINALLEVKSKGEIRYLVEEMPLSMLQRIYLSEGIRYSVLFFIDETEEAFYYGSISTGGQENPYNDVKKDIAITLLVDQIRNIFRRIKTA